MISPVERPLNASNRDPKYQIASARGMNAYATIRPGFMAPVSNTTRSPGLVNGKSRRLYSRLLSTPGVFLKSRPGIASCWCGRAIQYPGYHHGSFQRLETSPMPVTPSFTDAFETPLQWGFPLEPLNQAPPPGKAPDSAPVDLS